MPFIGNQPALSYTSFAKQDFTTSATTSYTLDQPVTNENEIALFINFVRQEPSTAYSASGTSLTLTSATSASDDMYCVFLGKAVQTVNPPSGSVGTAQLADSSVTSAKLGTGATNTPAFSAYLSSAQAVTDATWTKIQFNTEILDSNGTYDNSTNYRFTPASTGYYLINAGVSIQADSTNTMGDNYLALYKNGTSVSTSQQYGNTTNKSSWQPHTFSQIINVTSTSDYYECYAYADLSSGNLSLSYDANKQNTYFNASKLIGV